MLQMLRLAIVYPSGARETAGGEIIAAGPCRSGKKCPFSPAPPQRQGLFRRGTVYTSPFHDPALPGGHGLDLPRFLGEQEEPHE
jgi:hypothetical protein